MSDLGFDTPITRMTAPIEQTVPPSGAWDQITTLTITRGGELGMGDVTEQQLPSVAYTIRALRVRRKCKGAKIPHHPPAPASCLTHQPPFPTACSAPQAGFWNENMVVAFTPHAVASVALADVPAFHSTRLRAEEAVVPNMPTDEQGLAVGSDSDFVDLSAVVNPLCNCLSSPSGAFVVDAWVGNATYVITGLQLLSRQGTVLYEDLSLQATFDAVPPHRQATVVPCSLPQH